MFFRILKRDFKRKKATNLILLLFVLLASLLLSSSANNLSMTIGAVDQFIENAKVPDLFLIATAGKGQDELRNFIEHNPDIASYEVQDGITILNDEQITILGSLDESSEMTRNYERTTTLSVMPYDGSYMKVFDEDGEELHLENGEIALAKLEAEKNHLQKGDRIAITIGDCRKEFRVAAITRDAVFGTSFMGYKRHMISKEDFADFADQEQTVYTRMYCVDYGDRDAFQKAYTSKKFAVISGIEKNLIPMCYVFDMLMAGILIIVSVCMILISMLVLRFTISFTVSEEYREIGIMKAIGLNSRDIKKIYLIKYIAISILGSVIGVGLGIPFQEMLLKQVVTNVVLEPEIENIFINLLAGIFVVMVVVLYGNHCTNLVRKISVLEAIRSGTAGESFHRKSMMLSKHRRMHLPLFLACNDLKNQKKQFVVLLFCFVLGTMMLILSLIAATTLDGENIVYSFGMDKSDLSVTIGNEESLIDKGEQGAVEMNRYMEEMKQTLLKQGIECEIGNTLGFHYSVHTEGAEDPVDCIAVMPNGEWNQHLTMLDGREPQYENEIAITEITAQKLKAVIGDSLVMTFADREERFVITGTYQTMFNMGEQIRMSKNAHPDYTFFAGSYAYQIVLKESNQVEHALEVLKDKFPAYKIYRGREWVDETCGLDTVRMQLNKVMSLITVVVLFTNALITVLFVRSFLSKEQSEIALMKSLGFQSCVIKQWQLFRILLILAAGIMSGTLLSHLLAPHTIGLVFGMMGAKKMPLSVNPLMEFVGFPLLLLGVTGCAAYISTGGIRRIEVKEVSNIE